MERQEEIKLIAYRIWEEEKRHHGHDLEYWVRAEVIWEEQHKAKEPEKTGLKTASQNIEMESRQNNKTVKKTKSAIKKS